MYQQGAQKHWEAFANKHEGFKLAPSIKRYEPIIGIGSQKRVSMIEGIHDLENTVFTRDANPETYQINNSVAPVCLPCSDLDFFRID